MYRLEKDRMGEVSPEEYVPVLEEDELILPVGLWVFRKAVRACKDWIAVCPDFSVSVNVSALQIQEEVFLNQALQILREEQFPAENLILEITESYAIQNMEFIKQTFEALKARGVRIAMDDFGTGYSSLGVLKQAPVDVVKIDRAFVKDILDSKFDATFIRFVVEICHDVGLEVCLEGVETEEEYQIVKKMQLDDIQGYLFGKPMEAKRLTKRLTVEDGLYREQQRTVGWIGKFLIRNQFFRCVCCKPQLFHFWKDGAVGMQSVCLFRNAYEVGQAV